MLHVPVLWQGIEIHVIVAHFGLIHSSRVRQVDRLAEYIAAEVPGEAHVLVAGDFNDWGERLDRPMHARGLHRAQTAVPARTFPSRVPLFTLDRIYVRGFKCLTTTVPRGGAWVRMSDHLPLVVELQPD